MANFGLIDFKLGLYIKVNVNVEQKNVKFTSQKNGQNDYRPAQNRPVAIFGQEN